jgi:4-hydroxythreonine-4-phosphate dehydrogenase
MSPNRKPRIGLLRGDPSGIGPEIAIKLLEAPETRELADVAPLGGEPPACPMGKASATAGRYTLDLLRIAAESMRRGEIDALVYAPLNKQAMKMAGLEEEDELRFLARLLGHTGYCSEINICGSLWTTRVTSHVPLQEVAGLITAEKVYEATRLIDQALKAIGTASPRIAVAGLNPHAGEGGLLGTEEIREIGPGIARARAGGIAASGPFPADTVFIAASRGDFDAVVTMYHDQGQIATKLLGFDRGVTLLGGLPLPITTPAHGTAFDIAGKGVATAGAIREAFAIAVRLSVISRASARGTGPAGGKLEAAPGTAAN